MSGIKDNFLKRIVVPYADFISNHPWIIICIVILLFAVGLYGSKLITMSSSDYKTMIPQNLEVMSAMNLIDDSFGGSDSIMLAVEIDPLYSKGVESRDVRDPDVLDYIDRLTMMASNEKDVLSVSSASSILKSINAGVLPNSKEEIKSYMDNVPMLASYISKDRTMSLIKIRLSDSYDEDDLISNLQYIVDTVPGPSGINAYVAGDVAANPIVKNNIGPDVERTGQYSLVGIIIVLLLLFFSIRFAVLPLATILVGVIWAFGFIGFSGMKMSSMTSGVISMIMGIGIDFGIQIAARYRFERKSSDAKTAMTVTINNVFIPMLTTTLAALIGFKAMSMGQLTFLGEMGQMMSYGILFCFLAAITIVPALILVTEGWSFKKSKKEEAK